jgi:Rrf2 family protein
MMYIAARPDGARVLRSEIADAQSIPSSFMAKILRGLVRAGLLRSSRGIHGGFLLARPPNEITLLEVLEAVEGPLSLTDCVPDPAGCEFSETCPASSVWLQVQDEMASLLRDTNLENLVAEELAGRGSQALRAPRA